MCTLSDGSGAQAISARSLCTAELVHATSTTCGCGMAVRTSHTCAHATQAAFARNASNVRVQSATRMINFLPYQVLISTGKAPLHVRMHMAFVVRTDCHADGLNSKRVSLRKIHF